ncbi:hypothetical protein K461DRAFT_320357 [Myriangium duriaei CBS 260.36]|uniref:Uncharacterized protein n=1 Tax=Myriangium duriaei CBS 260.36 TaxID=1168546 RepID=A0A9P4J675_9PEZI|nr:hypothetical protein K461DRAFT_320357 [Myriangium duriaei CBS 260.36]
MSSQHVLGSTLIIPKITMMGDPSRTAITFWLTESVSNFASLTPALRLQAPPLASQTCQPPKIKPFEQPFSWCPWEGLHRDHKYRAGCSVLLMAPTDADVTDLGNFMSRLAVRRKAAALCIKLPVKASVESAPTSISFGTKFGLAEFNAVNRDPTSTFTKQVREAADPLYGTPPTDNIFLMTLGMACYLATGRKLDDQIVNHEYVKHLRTSPLCQYRSHWRIFNSLYDVYSASDAMSQTDRDKLAIEWDRLVWFVLLHADYVCATPSTAMHPSLTSALRPDWGICDNAHLVEYRELLGVMGAHPHVRAWLVGGDDKAYSARRFNAMDVLQCRGIECLRYD